MKNKKLMALLMVATMAVAMTACGGSDDSNADANNNVSTEAQNDAATNDDAANDDVATNDDAANDAAANDDAASDDAYVSSVTYGLNYGAEPEAFVGKWVLANAYEATAGDLAVPADACFLDIEISVDANKLVDEAAYIHADAKNLKGTMSFSADITESEYSCTGAWSDWTVVDVVGEGEAYFKGAVKFKVRDDDEGVYFDTLTGTTVEDMEMFNVVGMTADGKLVLGYSEDHIEKAGDAEWAYAYVFTKAE